MSEGQRGPQQLGEGLTQTEGVGMEKSGRGQMEEIMQEGNPQELATVCKWKAKEREERGGSLESSSFPPSTDPANHTPQITEHRKTVYIAQNTDSSKRS